MLLKILSRFLVFDKRETLRKIFINSSWLLLDRLIRMLGSLLIGIWVARYLGPRQYGIINYAVAFVGLFSVLSTLGMDAIVVRNLVKDRSNAGIQLGTSFVLRIAGAFTSFFLAVATVMVLKGDESVVVVVVAIVAVGNIFQAFDVIDVFFQSDLQSKLTVIAKNAAFLLLSLVKIVLIISGSGLYAFAATGVAEIFVGAIGLVICYRKSGYDFRSWRFRLQTARQLLKESWPLILSGIIVMIYLRIDQIMLGQMKTETEVGIYSAAVRVSEVWYFIPTIIVNSVMPSIIKAKGNSEREYEHRLRLLFGLVASLGFLLIVPLSLASSWIIQTLYGSNYIDAGPVLAIQAWTGLFVFLGVARGPWIIAEGLTRFSFMTTAFGAVSNIVLNIILIPKYSMIGASIATLISYAIASVGANALFASTRPIFIMQLRAMFLFETGLIFNEFRRQRK